MVQLPNSSQKIKTNPKQKNMKKILIIGSSGLIGSEVCADFAQKCWAIHGVDNNPKVMFFGQKWHTL